MAIAFHAPCLTDRDAVRNAAELSRAKENDAAFASIFLLRHKYSTCIAFENNAFYRFYGKGVRAGCFGYPLGAVDLLRDIPLMRKKAAEWHQPFKMGLLTKEMCDALSEAYPEQFRFLPADGYTEYLYLRENLANLSGSRYHGKRNHIAQFRRDYPTYAIQPLSAENADFAVKIAKDWLMARENPLDISLQGEFACIQEATQHFAELGLSGLLLYADEKPIGMTIVSEISEGIADIHFEKVIAGYPHAWPVVANEMAKCLPNALYINREEDLGEVGMRTSKASYHPDLTQEKFFAEWIEKE